MKSMRRLAIFRGIIAPFVPVIALALAGCGSKPEQAKGNDAKQMNDQNMPGMDYSRMK